MRGVLRRPCISWKGAAIARTPLFHKDGFLSDIA